MTHNVLVTGGTGYLGRALIPRLEALGYLVASVSRTTGTDLCDPEVAARALSPWRWDAVVHLAGPAPKTDLNWSEAVATIRAHVQSAVHVAAAVPPEWPGRFIHASGAIVYGLPEELPVRETHPRRPLHAYALAKCLSEDVLLGSALRDRWILRMGGLFSTARRSGALFHFVRAARRGEDLRVTSANPPVPWELLHVDDAVEAIVRALRSTGRDPGALNVGYGEPIQIVALAEGMARRSTTSRVTLEGPAPPVFHADIAKARGLIEWPPKRLSERLEELWAAGADDVGP